tara:strand:- start:2335 stop:2463 length:129 start_codon:yes stop_codon:yes gene_type:complete
MSGWIEDDGTEYILREDGNYDVIPPKKAAKKKPASKKKAKKE